MHRPMVKMGCFIRLYSSNTGIRSRWRRWWLVCVWHRYNEIVPWSCDDNGSIVCQHRTIIITWDLMFIYKLNIIDVHFVHFIALPFPTGSHCASFGSFLHFLLQDLYKFSVGFVGKMWVYLSPLIPCVASCIFFKCRICYVNVVLHYKL